MINRSEKSKVFKSRAARKRLGMSYMSLLDMLTCCLGAILVLWIASNGSISSSKGIAPGKSLEFKVINGTPNGARIGVRVKTKDGGIQWAGETSQLNPSIVIDPAEEGASSMVTLILQDSYSEEDMCYVFVHQLEGGKLWGNEQNVSVQVTRNLVSLGEALSFHSEKLFYQCSLMELTEGTNPRWR